ncbi:MAG: indolepyruvate oxidoreductase subunit beta [Calditerrivibrio sp.]|nr:indolepyruvate oxidoreductase subunit beta [Calditerrivibrio sp.]
MKSYNILVIGVGGQGSVLASDIICETALLENTDVKKSEVHGMAQRGGSVVSHVRIGEKVYSPTISLGDADYVVSLERMEFLRYMEFVSKKTILISNAQKIIPSSIINDAELYPDKDINLYKKNFKKSYEFDAFEVAKNLGNPRGVGVVMLGFLSVFLPFSKENWEKAISFKVPKKTIETNILVFRKGLEIGQNRLK